MQVGVQEFIELQSGGYKATVLEVPIRYAIFYQILNILGFLGSVAVTILGLIGIFPYTFEEIRIKYVNLFSVAPYAYGIWGLIYFFFLIFVIYQALPFQRTNEVLFKGINILFFITCLINITAVVVLCFEYIWTAFALTVILFIFLIVIYYRINRGARWRNQVQEYWFIYVPFSIYTGWIYMEVFIILAMAVRWQTDFALWSAEGWVLLVLAIMAVTAIILLHARMDWVFGWVITWGCIAIAVQHPDNFDLFTGAIVIGSFVGIFSFIALIVKLAYWSKENGM